MITAGRSDTGVQVNFVVVRLLGSSLVSPLYRIVIGFLFTLPAAEGQRRLATVQLR